MTRIAIFTDLTWLDFNRDSILGGSAASPQRIDFRSLPAVLAGEARRVLGLKGGLSIVGVFCFGSLPMNCDAADSYTVAKIARFHDTLSSLGHKLHIRELDLRGRRLRRSDRDPHDGMKIAEKGVDVALASELVLLAAKDAYDVAVCVIGDFDFAPALEAVRRLGKRVVVASSRSSCSMRYLGEGSPVDADVIWLDSLARQIRHESSADCIGGDAVLGGVISSIGRSFGFINGDDGHVYFFAPQSSETFELLSVGTVVSFSIATRAGGREHGGKGAAARVRAEGAKGTRAAPLYSTSSF